MCTHEAQNIWGAHLGSLAAAATQLSGMMQLTHDTKHVNNTVCRTISSPLYARRPAYLVWYMFTHQ